MNVKELRIGNYYRTGKGKIAETESIRALVVMGVCTDTKKQIINDYKDVEPIRITEEWLLKLGWKYQDKRTHTKMPPVRFYFSNHFGEDKEFCLELCLPANPIDKCVIWLNWDIGAGNQFIHLPYEIKYVHQLQNLYYALAGEELPYNISKSQTNKD